MWEYSKTPWNYLIILLILYVSSKNSFSRNISFILDKGVTCMIFSKIWPPENGRISLKDYFEFKFLWSKGNFDVDSNINVLIL